MAVYQKVIVSSVNPTDHGTHLISGCCIKDGQLEAESDGGPLGSLPFTPFEMAGPRATELRGKSFDHDEIAKWMVDHGGLFRAKDFLTDQLKALR